MIEAQLDRDWLDALAILRRSIDSHDIREVWARFAPEVIPGPAHRLVVPREGEGIEIILDIRVMHEWLSLPKIERVEIMTFAACGAWFSLHFPGDPFAIPREAFQHLCFRAGCWFKNTQEIRERWRLIDFYRAAAELPNACFEDRLKCMICSQPVATGAGAWVKAGADFGTTIQTEPSSEDTVRYKRDIHEECMRYVHRVLVPQVKAFQESTKGTTAEADK